jgi:hypothetical protein
VTLKFPDDSKRCRIVFQLIGPVRRLQVRHVPSDWLFTSQGCGADVAASVEELRGRARRQGYLVDEGYATEDLRTAAWGGKDDG